MFSLSHKIPTFPDWIVECSLTHILILQKRVFASSAFLSSGSSLWVLGGSPDLYHMHNSTEILERGVWRAGTDMTGERASHCSVTLTGDRVVVTGGYDGRQTLDVVEMFSPGQGWTRLQSMATSRQDHSCARAWVDNSTGEVVTYNRERSVLAIVVAGGKSFYMLSVDNKMTYFEMLASFSKERL